MDQSLVRHCVYACQRKLYGAVTLPLISILFLLLKQISYLNSYILLGFLVILILDNDFENYYHNFMIIYESFFTYHGEAW